MRAANHADGRRVEGIIRFVVDRRTLSKLLGSWEDHTKGWTDVLD